VERLTLTLCSGMLEVRMRMKANKIAVVTALGAVVLNASLLMMQQA